MALLLEWKLVPYPHLICSSYDYKIIIVGYMDCASAIE